MGRVWAAILTRVSARTQHEKCGPSKHDNSPYNTTAVHLKPTHHHSPQLLRIYIQTNPNPPRPPTSSPIPNPAAAACHPCDPTSSPAPSVPPVGDSHKGPLNNQRKPAYLRKKTNANEPKNTRKINPRAHSPPDNRPSHPRAELCFARGAWCRAGKTPPRSRAGRPLG
jgi:hypothetical protein